MRKDSVGVVDPQLRVLSYNIIVSLSKYCLGGTVSFRLLTAAHIKMLTHISKLFPFESRDQKTLD